MNDYELYDKFEQMRDELGAEVLLGELFSAMTTDEVEANLKYIARIWDMDTFEED